MSVVPVVPAEVQVLSEGVQSDDCLRAIAKR